VGNWILLFFMYCFGLAFGSNVVAGSQAFTLLYSTIGWRTWLCEVG
jgi:hypothetical protein